MNLQPKTQAIADRVGTWWRLLLTLIIDSALTLFPPLAQWRHQSAKNHCDLGEIYYERGDYSKAEEQFNKALKYDYDSLRAQKGLGYTLQALGKLSEAIYISLRYLQQDDQDPDVLLNLAVALHNSGKYVEALQYYHRAEKLDPKNPIIPENRGRALYMLGKIDEAIGSLRQALNLNPDNPEAHRFLGLALESRGNREQALESYQAALTLEPENGNVHLDVAMLLEKMARYKEAVEHAHMAANLLEKQEDTEGATSAYWELGWNYYKLGDWARSVEASQRALQIKTNAFGARFNLGLALLHQDRQKDAVEEYRKGLEDVTLASDVKHWAIDDLQGALKVHPHLPGGKEILGTLQSRYESLKKTRGTPNTSLTS